MASVDIICHGTGNKLENQRPQSESWFIYVTSGKAFHSINVKWRAGLLDKLLCSEEKPFSCQSSFLQNGLSSFSLWLSESFYVSADSHNCHFYPTISSYPHFSLHRVIFMGYEGCWSFSISAFQKFITEYSWQSFLNIYQFSIRGQYFQIWPRPQSYSSSPVMFDFENNSKHKQKDKWHF